MKILSCMLFIMFFIWLPTFCFAAPEFALPISSSQKVSTSLENNVQNLEIKIKLLEQINGKILNTIYWALGGLMTVFLAIIGLNFFQNFNINKSKIDAIKKAIDQNFKKNALELEDKNKKILEIMNSEMELKIKSEVKSLLNKMKSEVDEIKDEYGEIKRENFIRSAYDHKQKNQMGYILNMIYALDHDIEKGWDWRIHESLNNVATCLDENFKDSNVLTQLQIVLDKLPSQYASVKKNIESKMTL